MLLVPTAPACSSSVADSARGAAGTSGRDSGATASGGQAPPPSPSATAAAGSGTQAAGGATAASVAPFVPDCSGDASFEASYHVPVSAELEPYATFVVSDLWFCQDDTAELRYDLPRALVGGSERVELAGALEPGGTALDLAGRLGNASCTATGAQGTRISCAETLPGVTVDRAKVLGELAGLPPDEAAARSAVSDAFSQDPIGVVTFEVAAHGD